MNQRLSRYFKFKQNQLHPPAAPGPQALSTKWEDFKKAAREKAWSAKEQLKRWSKAFLCCGGAKQIAAAITGFFVFLLIFHVVVFVARWLNPVCSVSPDGRTCNDRGTCVQAKCVCDPLFSGDACTETAIPGYSLGENTVCSTNGYEYPFTLTPTQCQQSLNNRGVLEGPGWADLGCIEYLQSIQEKLDETGGNPLLVPDAIYLPMCVCIPPFTGKDCSRKGCPADLNGRVCGGHGNTTVGVFQNGTTNGLGCQCQRPTGYFEEEFRSQFTAEARVNITNFYYTTFNTLYCGTILVSPQDPNIQFMWQQADDYKCYCTDDWKGVACTEGKCPFNPQTEDICYGNGHPALGFGYNSLSVFSTNSQGQECTPRCTTDYRLCGERIGGSLEQFRSPTESRCVEEQDPFLPQFSESQFCNNPEKCPSDTPIRCADGSCNRYPTAEQHGCVNGYSTGVWDWGQLNQSLAFHKCANLTSTRHVTSCFQNFTGPVPGLLGLADVVEVGAVGGVVLNTTIPVQVDLSSPLLFFSMQVSQSEGWQARVMTWDGQSVVSSTFPDPSPQLFSGAFNYPIPTLLNSTFLPTSQQVTLTPYLDDKFSVGPILDQNYSGSVLFPANYTFFRVRNAIRNISYAFDTVGSNLTLSTFDPLLVNSSVVFVGGEDGEGGLTSISLEGRAITPSTCFGTPALCAWYVDGEQLRSLTPPFIYVCESGGVVITQSTPCAASFLTWAPTLTYPQRVELGQLYLIGLSRTNISQEHLDLTFTLDRNTTQNNTFTIDFLLDGNTTLSAANTTATGPVLQGITFLTQDRLQVPCACDLNTVTMLNMSTFNRGWWLQSSERTPRTFLDVGQHVLAADSGVEDDLYLRRGWVVETDPVARTAQIQAWKGSNSLFRQYWAELRTLTVPEFLRGWDDCNQTALPGRCPDGTCSRLEAVERTIPTLCNCTMEVRDEGTNTLCSCSDSDLKEWGCLCGAERCDCGAPTTVEFESNLFEELQSRVQGGCSCDLVRVPPTPPTATIQEQASGGGLEFDFNQQPVRYITLLRDNCTAPLTVSAIASDFTDNYTDVTFWQDPTSTNCTPWIIPDLDPSIPYDKVRVEGEGLINGTIYLSLRGYMLLPDSASASSNSNQATNVFTNNNTLWLSSGSLREAPVWIDVEFGAAQVVEQVLVDFYTAASLLMDATLLPRRVYMFGGNDGRHWYQLTSFNVSAVNSTEVFSATLPSPLYPYSRYRLAMENGALGIRRIELYSGQQCSCGGGGGLYLGVDSQLAGFKTTQDWLNSIDYELSNLNSLLPCVGTNNCTIQLLPGETAEVSEDGVCEDAIYVASELGVAGTTVLLSTDTFDYSRVLVNYTSGGVSPIQVQLANSSLEFLDTAEMTAAYTLYQATGRVIPTFSNTSTLVVFFLTSDNRTLVRWGRQSDLVFQYYEGAGEMVIETYETIYGSLVSQGLACPPGQDVTDCGPSNRLPLLLPNVNCTLNETAQGFRDAQLNRTTVGITNTVTLQNLTTQLTGEWNATFTQIPLDRYATSLSLLDCGGQVCPAATPFRCDSGACVEFPSGCGGDRYECPGNGCVLMSGASEFEAYGCACAPFFGGLECNIGDAIPAQPRNQFAVPVGGEITCGQPPPLREKPPFVNLLPTEPNTLQTLLEINNRQTGNSAPLSSLDVAYLRVMPQAAPWGKPLQWCYTQSGEEVITFQQKRICGTCPPARRGSRGEYVLLDDDVLTRDPTTGEVLEWRPDSNGEIHPWSSIIAYNDFPYRCPNGACVASEKECERSVILYPVCNNRGRCRADGSCLCDPGWRSFSITTQFSERMKWPYSYSAKFGGPDPTDFKINFNWRDFGQNWCTARDCTVVDCTAPSACFPGTPELDFADRLVPCRASTGVPGKCARDQQACAERTDLRDPLRCAGNGIPRLKDFTGEEYCACGDPVSETQVIQNLTSIAQLKSNGWGGPSCTQYFAPTSATPVVWSTWNWALNEPWRSAVTGEDLPGKWVGWGTLPIGADPDDIIVWQQCCDPALYPRLESCPFVPCRVEGEIVCRNSENCGPGGGETALVYYCNNHGVPRADSTCSCDREEELGEGYTFDLDQFSEKGCFRRVRCEVSRLNNLPCNYIDPCSEPEQWRNPLPPEPYWSQNWLVCCLDGLGQPNNLTLMSTINSNVPNFDDQLLQAYTANANLVAEAIAGLNGCRCVYPDDTTNSKTGMLPGSDLPYNANFKSPYQLELTPINSTGITPPQILVDGALFSTPSTPASRTFTQGQNFTFQLNTSTTLQAIRLFNRASTNAVVSFLNDAGGEACTDFTDFDSLLNVLDWDTQFCGAQYSCKNFRTESEYDAQCGTDAQSAACLAWKETTCNAEVGGQYWPPGQPDIFNGCARDDDFFGCVCCIPNIIFTNPETTTVTVVVESGEVELGEVRMYGYTSTALAVPASFRTYLNRRAPNTECNDFLFLQSTLEPDNSFYAPLDTGESTQQPRNRSAAEARCQETGGWLPVPTNLDPDTINGLEFAPGFSEMNRVCEGLSQNLEKRCWVDAENRQYTLPQYLTRDDLFTPGCQDYGCWAISFAQGDVVMSMNSTTNLYQSQVISGQLSGADFIRNGINSYQIMGVDNFQRVGLFSRDPNTATAGTTQCSMILGRGCIHSGPCASTVTLGAVDWSAYLDLAYTGTLYFRAARFYVASYLEEGYSYWRSSPPDCFDFRVVEGAGSDIDLTNPSGRRGVVVTPGDFCGGLLAGSIWCILPIEGVAGDWFIMYPAGGAYLVEMNFLSRRLATTGTIGNDFVMGFDTYPYQPYFMTASVFRTMDVNANQGSDNRQNFAIPGIPRYVRRSSGLYTFAETFPVFTPAPPRCLSCYLTLGTGQTAYDRHTYSTTSTWGPNLFSPPFPPRLQIQQPEGWRALLDLRESKAELFAHQTVYIQEYQRAGAVEWNVDACVAAGPEGYTTAVCQEEELNFVCQYDYTKYAVQTGSQCPPCGPSTRSGGQAAPGVTCFDQFQLANATAFPEQHQVYLAQQQGTLDLLVASFNLNGDQEGANPYEGYAVFPGCEKAWELWRAGVSTRQRSASRGAIPQENWCDMNLVDNYPVSCGLRRNSTTGVKDFYCAAEEELCPLDVELPQVPIASSQIPPLLGPVDPSLSFTDPTCGPNIPLESYFQVDKYGGLQTQLQNHQNILELTPTYIRAEVTSQQTWDPPGWWNGGKAPARYVFETNVTATVSGRIRINCASCSPTLTIYIHPISPTTYARPTDRISQTVSITPGSIQSYAVEFTPNQTEAGGVVIGGIQFPNVVYRGVGFELGGLGSSDSYTLYNPVITDPTTREECQNRTLPTFYEPLGRAKSEAPDNQCVITEDDLERYGNLEVGTCACDLPFTGPACDCPALVDSKFGKKVCGGLGDEFKAVIPPSGGEAVETGGGDEAGCYIYTDGEGQKRSQCKCIPIGTAAWTLQYPPSLWDWPRVFVETPPVRGAPLFVLAVSGGWVEKAEVALQCVLQVAGGLPYALGSGEYTALAEEFQTTLPVYLDMSWDGTGFLWDTPNQYFSQSSGNTYTPCPVDISSTTLEREMCRTINYNNFGYGTAVTTSLDEYEFTDGDVSSISSTATTVTLEIQPAAPFNFRVVVWPLTTISAPTITAPNGDCTTPTYGTNTWESVCRAGDRIVTVAGFSAGEVSEVQVFAEDDLSRSTAYALP